MHIVLPENRIFLAPMAGVTDLPFRLLCLRFGAGFAYTEMVSAKGLYYGNKNTALLTDTGGAADKTSVQLFGSDPDIMRYAAEYLENAGARYIDINMGCPMPKIVKNGDGCALMAKPETAGRIIEKTAASVNIPVTIKIRAGTDKEHINAAEIARIAESSGAAAITVHGRTLDQYYSGAADWGIIKQVKAAVTIPVIGNGDVKNIQDAQSMQEQTNCDAVMIGRAALGNPWVFAGYEPDTDERLETAAEHARAIVCYKGEYIGVREMRKHMCWYLKGLKNAAKKKALIMSAEKLNDMLEIIKY